MAIPTFTSIDVSTGHPGGGQVIEVVGTGFRVRTATVQIPDQQTQPTVRVRFEGVSAGSGWANNASVRVLSDTLLRVSVPEFKGNPNIPGILDASLTRLSFPACNIVIQNVDDAGVDIPGETVTATGVYTYEQPLLSLPDGDPPLMQITRELIYMLKRQVISRVGMNTHTDFGEDGATATFLAEHPAIDILLSVEDDDEYKYLDNDQYLIDQGTHWDSYDQPNTVMLSVLLTISSQWDHEIHRMLDALFEMRMRSPWLTLAHDLNPDNDGRTLSRYPLEFTQLPQMIGRASRVNVEAYQARLQIRGIVLVSEDPIAKYFKRATFRLMSTDMNVTATQTVEA